MDILKRKSLGRSGVMVPALGLGGAPIGGMFQEVSEDDARSALQAAWDAGIRYFDTAPWYGLGQSEHRFGRFLGQGTRAELILSTKVGRILKAPPDPSRFDRGVWVGGLPFDHVFDYSYDGVMRSYEDSLQRVGMPRVDMLVIHDLDFWHHATEANVTAYLHQLATGGWRALDELKRHGLISAVGAGINELGMIPRFLDLVSLDFFLVALRYTLLEQEVLSAEFPLCERHAVSVVLGGVFNSGILASGPTEGAIHNYAPATLDVRRKVERINSICARHDTPLAAAAIQFSAAHPLVASVLLGAVDGDQVNRNVELAARAIPSALWEELRHEGLIRADAPPPVSDAPAGHPQN